jgi:hypothetical protein
MNINSANLAEFWYSEAKAIGSEYNEIMGDFYAEVNQQLNEQFAENNFKENIRDLNG